MRLNKDAATDIGTTTGKREEIGRTHSAVHIRQSGSAGCRTLLAPGPAALPAGCWGQVPCRDEHCT